MERRSNGFWKKPRRDVTIRLLNEDRTDVVFTWRLVRAWPVKYVAGTLNAKANEVIIEALELANEGIERVS